MNKVQEYIINEWIEYIRNTIIRNILDNQSYRAAFLEYMKDIPIVELKKLKKLVDIKEKKRKEMEERHWGTRFRIKDIDNKLEEQGEEE